VSLVSENKDAYDVRLAVAFAGKRRYYAISARALCDGWEFSLDDAGDAAMQAMARGKPSEYWGSHPKPAKRVAKAYRLCVTGHILDEWLARFSQGGLLGVVPTTASDIEDFSRVDSACRFDADDRGWDDWEVLGGRTD